jgi:hypothetical protein
MVKDIPFWSSMVKTKHWMVKKMKNFLISRMIDRRTMQACLGVLSRLVNAYWSWHVLASKAWVWSMDVRSLQERRDRWAILHVACEGDDSNGLEEKRRPTSIASNVAVLCCCCMRSLIVFFLQLQFTSCTGRSKATFTPVIKVIDIFYRVFFKTFS